MKKLILLLLVITLAACGGSSPEVVLNKGFDIIAKDTSWVDSGCNLVVDGEEIAIPAISSSINLSEYGEYEVIYSIEYEGKDYSCKRVVKVIDTESPVVVINSGIDTIYIGDTWINAGVTAVDNSGTNTTTIVSGFVDASVAGTYEVTYSVTDEYYNQTIVRRIVNVIERD